MVRTTLRFTTCVLMTSFMPVAVGFAKGRDHNLLTLVPPGSQLVAGMSAPATPGQPDSYLLLTHNNRVDLEDFLALTGVDSSRVIHQVIFVAGGPTVDLSEHSLLASGYFNYSSIWKAAVANGAATIEWNGLLVVAVAPFAREQGVIQEARWLTVPRPQVAIFGTEASVRAELDREETRSEPDASLVRSVDRLREDDASWCVITSLPARDEVWLSLEAIYPALPRLLRSGDGFAFGTRFGTKVQFEYELTVRTGTQAHLFANAITHSLLGSEGARALLDEGGGYRATRGVVKVSNSRYQAWLAEIRHGNMHVVSYASIELTVDGCAQCVGSTSTIHKRRNGMTKSCFKTLTVGFGAVVLGSVCTLNAGAQCGGLGSLKATPTNWQGQMSPAAPATLMPAALLLNISDRNDDDFGIVGFWHVKLFAKGNDGIPDDTEIDAGYSQWHSDGTEFLNSAAHLPLTNNICQGVWKQIGHNRYKLNHVIMAWDASGQKLVGPASFREIVTLGVDHDHYRASFTIDQYDLSGNLLAHVAGYETAERVTVDSGVPTIF